MNRALGLVALAFLSALGAGAYAYRSRPVDMRVRIDDALRSEVDPLRTRADVERYLEQLRIRARAQGRVTALEVETGVAAIEKLTLELGPDATQEWTATFVRSMAALSHSIKGGR